MAAEVRIPTLTASEYAILLEAVKQFKVNEHYIATDSHTDIKLRNEARTRTVKADDLLMKIS